MWSDEFELPTGAKPDPAKWSYDIGGNGWGNQELESYTSRTNNARIEGGMLVIEARQEDYTGADGVARHYTSARLKTQGKYNRTYGRIEARMQLPRGQGVWPAFWTLGSSISAVGWPACGEIDIMENIGKEPSTIHGTVHGPGYSGANGIGHPYALPAGQAFADGFHVYALEWAAGQVRFLVDNTAYFTVTPASLPAGKSWVFNDPEFILLNLAIGGDWPGAPDASTQFPQRLLVDYVRLYAPAAAATPTLKVLNQTNHVLLEWPGVFPQALVQTAGRPSGPWLPRPADGARTSTTFFTDITPGSAASAGFFRLTLGD